MSSTFIGQRLHLSIFGQSHSEAIGMTLDGLPAGIKIDIDRLQTFLNRRAPGQNAWSTPRKEADQPEILSGLNADGLTCGAPITAVIRNSNTRSGDYEALKDDPLIEADTIGLKGSPTNVFKSFTPPQKGGSLMLTGDDAASQLAAILAEKHLI